MWLFNLKSARIARTLTTYALVLALGACGFEPLYTQKDALGPSENLLATIDIATIRDRDGQQLRNALIDRLHTQGQAAPRYRLVVSPPQKSVVSIGVRKDATATRGQMSIDTTMTLTDLASGEKILTRKLHTVGGYNKLDNLYAAQVSEDYATQRILEETADKITLELALYFKRPPEARLQQDLQQNQENQQDGSSIPGYSDAEILSEEVE